MTSFLPPSLSLENNGDNLRDVSFSAYLNSTKETLVQKLAGANQILSPTGAGLESHNHLVKKKQEDGEIGVFGAEKYFNGGIDEDGTPISTNKSEQEKNKYRDIMVPVKPKVYNLGTPSVNTESSSNSQSALLKRIARNPSQRKTRSKLYGKSFFSGLGCSCSDKDSTDVDEHVGEISFKNTPNADAVQREAITKEQIKTSLGLELIPGSETWIKKDISLDKMGVGLNKKNGFTFPTLNSVAENPPTRKQFQLEVELNPRMSLEVFGSPIYEKRNKALSLERRLSMLSWDGSPKMEEIEFSATSGGLVYNDNESDASSDLFEIESLTGKVTPFLARQGSDATSAGCRTPTTCYAPSEASVEWSVVTASAADFSVVSDFEELRPTMRSPTKVFPTSTDAKAGTTKEVPRRRPSSLLGCKSQKAVRVAGDAYRTIEKANFEPRMRRISDSYIPVTRFQAETKLTAGSDSRPRQNAALATQSLPHSRSPHSSRLLYV